MVIPTETGNDKNLALLDIRLAAIIKIDLECRDFQFRSSFDFCTVGKAID